MVVNWLKYDQISCSSSSLPWVNHVCITRVKKNDLWKIDISLKSFGHRWKDWTRPYLDRLLAFYSTKEDGITWLNIGVGVLDSLSHKNARSDGRPSWIGKELKMFALYLKSRVKTPTYCPHHHQQHHYDHFLAMPRSGHRLELLISVTFFFSLTYKPRSLRSIVCGRWDRYLFQTGLCRLRAIPQKNSNTKNSPKIAIISWILLEWLRMEQSSVKKLGPFLCIWVWLLAWRVTSHATSENLPYRFACCKPADKFRLHLR